MSWKRDTLVRTGWWGRVCAGVIFGSALATNAAPLSAQTQAVLPVAAPMPEPIHWKHELFLIPYQWNSGATANAQSVRLLASLDRGATWQTVSEAKPNVKAFNYRAPGDGEYWFAVRTIDAQGRAWPAGAYQPELRVIVDKRLPQLEVAEAKVRDDGSLDVRWSANDEHINHNLLRLEVQYDANGAWLPIASTPSVPLSPTMAAGQMNWRPPSGRLPVALRVSVSDIAGNSATSTVAIAQVSQAPSTSPIAVAPPAERWTSASPAPDAIARSMTVAAAPSQLPNQPWPASTAGISPYRVFDSATGVPTETATRYGNPLGVGREAIALNEPGNSSEERTRPATLEPFRQASLRRLPVVEAGAEARQPESAVTPLQTQSTSTPLPPGVEPKRLNSRTFALEYELSDVGRWGVSRVELWGTRNGGQTWRRFAQDDDLRSPIQTTVEGEGFYGFRILAESAGGAPVAPPQPGEAPEMWVEVDLHRPFAELTAVEPGAGNLADHIVLRWRAEDDNLESRPIAIFYSSRPAGPWSVIAADLENTGEYSWRVERHVPDRCYLRLEVRDLAGNRGTYQTLEPISLLRPQPSIQLRGAVPADGNAAAHGPLQR
jgi:hypothetical protein